MTTYFVSKTTILHQQIEAEDDLADEEVIQLAESHPEKWVTKFDVPSVLRRRQLKNYKDLIDVS
jgi:hypothetical protein